MATHCFYGARELYKDPVAHRLDDATCMPSNDWGYEFAALCLKSGERAFLVCSHELDVTLRIVAVPNSLLRPRNRPPSNSICSHCSKLPDGADRVSLFIDYPVYYDESLRLKARLVA